MGFDANGEVQGQVRPEFVLLEAEDQVQASVPPPCLGLGVSSVSGKWQVHVPYLEGRGAVPRCWVGRRRMEGTTQMSSLRIIPGQICKELSDNVNIHPLLPIPEAAFLPPHTVK